MKIYIISPIVDTFFTSEERKLLEQSGEIIYQKEIVPIEDVPGLCESGRKIIALDPDWFNWTVNAELLDKIPDIAAVILQTTSFSWIDTNYLKQKGVPVVNMRGFSKNSVAEWAIMVALLLARKMPILMKDNWRQDFVKHKGFELKDKTAGVIGLGQNGIAIAERAQAMGMKVQYWSKNSRDNRFTNVELSELMKMSDVVFPTFAHNAETEGLLTDELLISMKTDAIFISTIHHIYNHDLLLKRVAEGLLWGYGFEENNPSPEKYQGNVFAGPALAWCTEESMRENARQWVGAICASARGEFKNLVN